MRRFRFTIASLIGVVLFTAVAFAALREATALWDSIVFTVSACILLAAVLLAVHRAGPARAFWLGFALFGGGYLVATLVTSVEARLATTHGLKYLASKVPDRNQQLVLGKLTGAPANATTTFAFTSTPGGPAIAGGSQGSIKLWNASTGSLILNVSGDRDEFVRIGHSFVALLAALGGGWFSRWLFAAARRREENSVQPDPGAA